MISKYIVADIQGVNIKCIAWRGVPQGSFLGPNLYLLFIYDILEIINVEIATFANDTDILAIGANVDKIFNVNCRKKNIFIYLLFLFITDFKKGASRFVGIGF